MHDITESVLMKLAKAAFVCRPGFEVKRQDRSAQMFLCGA